MWIVATHELGESVLEVFRKMIPPIDFWKSGVWILFVNQTLIRWNASKEKIEFE